MLNKETLRRWKREGIDPTETIVALNWRCPVCGADRAELQYVSDKTPEAVMCSICDLPFSVPHQNQAALKHVLPLPAVSDDWITAWKLAHKDRAFKKACRAVGHRGFARMLKTFPSARKAIEFFEADKEEVPA